ncbi:hypothetical protein K461DRAFT_201762, partial [Myriangium duriaei CBS 260.36]
SNPSIGIRRLPSSQSIQTVRSYESNPQTPGVPPSPARNIPPQSQSQFPSHELRDIPERYSSIDFGNRRRSSSEPRPMIPPQYVDNNLTNLTRASTRPENLPPPNMPTVAEESNRPRHVQINDRSPSPGNAGDTTPDTPTKKSIAARAFGRLNPHNRGNRSRAQSNVSHVEYDPDLVNLLDVIDPEVSTLSTLTNVQNSLFIPDLGSLINRRPTYNLSAIPGRLERTNTARTDDQLQEKVDEEAEIETLARQDSDAQTITSRLSDSHYAVLPHGVSLEGWTDEEKAELEDHVRHMLHSRRAAFRRGLKGFGQYVRRPLGFFVTLYATLITLFGFAWVLFLIGWVNLGAKRDYIINVIDNVLVALFAVMGDGLIPFRTIDTYHMIYIAHYHHLTWNIRKKMKLPDLPNHNDLPNQIHPSARGPSNSIDLEALRPSSSLSSGDSGDSGHPNYYSVLTEQQQRKLDHHQAKFARSHTFYKPHETETHFAFPLRLLVAIVVLLDFHSVFQIALGTCTWAIPYETRPFVLTTVILICSITCNVTGGVLISVGDRRTRKKEVRERMFRQQLTEDAIKDVQKKKRKE